MPTYCTIQFNQSATFKQVIFKVQVQYSELIVETMTQMDERMPCLYAYIYKTIFFAENRSDIFPFQFTNFPQLKNEVCVIQYVIPRILFLYTSSLLNPTFKPTKDKTLVPWLYISLLAEFILMFLKKRIQKQLPCYCPFLQDSHS